MGSNCAIIIKAWSIVLDYGSNYALLVQLVERRSPKPDVGGSSPPGRAFMKSEVPQRSCGATAQKSEVIIDR